MNAQRVLVCDLMSTSITPFYAETGGAAIALFDALRTAGYSVRLETYENGIWEEIEMSSLPDVSENVFWITVWKIIAAFASVLTVSISSCTAYTHSQVSADIARGIDPMKVMCAHNMTGTNTECAIMASKETK